MGEKGDGFETIEEPGGDPARTASTRSSAVAASDRPVWNRGSLSARSSRGFLPDRNLTSEPFARSSLGQETPPLCFGGCQSHQPQRIRVPGVSRLAPGGSRTIRTTPPPKRKDGTGCRCTGGGDAPRSIAISHVFMGIHPSGVPYHESHEHDDATTTHVVGMHRAIDTRAGGRSILILLDLPPMRPSPHLTSGRDGTHETSSHRWTPPSVASNRPSHVRSIGTPLQWFGNVALCWTLRRTCAFEIVRGICTASSSVHAPSRNVPNRAGWSNKIRKVRNHVGREGTMRPCSRMQGSNAIGGAHVRLPCVMAIFSYALVTGSATVGWRRGSHRFVSRFLSSSNSSSYVPRSHAWLLSIAGCWIGTTRTHGRCPAVDPSCLVSRTTYDVGLDRVVWCSIVVGWQL